MEPGNRKILVYQPAYIWLITIICVILLASAAYLLFQRGIRYADTEWSELKRQSDALSGQLQETREQNDDLRQQIAILARSSEIDRLASLEVRNEFVVLQDKLLVLREELAFYRSIVSPAGNKVGLQIQRFDLQTKASAGHYRYQLVLTQVKNNERYVRGSIEITVEGVEGGKKRVLPLSALTGTDKALKFKFRYFQEFDGQLAMPKGFVPARLVVKVKPNGKGRPPSVEKVVEWPL
ncbi:hypothetical protein MNBD_GAMMA13-612 [hydrothermal vent metagenome]|uniref:Uncharacterized protein n=1 Tax=hydrothermal vent metagenome TaxID=652676 RepID=A0A3B0Z3S3_9ZZZZ